MKKIVLLPLILVLILGCIPANASGIDDEPFNFGFISIDLPFAPIISNKITNIDAEGIGVSIHEAYYPDPESEDEVGFTCKMYYLETTTDFGQEEIGQFLDQLEPFSSFFESFESASGFPLDIVVPEGEWEAALTIGSVEELPTFICVCWKEKSLVAITATFEDINDFDVAIERLNTIEYTVDPGEVKALITASLDQPPEIDVTINGTEVPYLIGMNQWNGVAYDREDTFHSLLKNKPELPVFEIGNEVTIRFPSSELMPDAYDLKDYLLDSSGSEKYNPGEADLSVKIEFAEDADSEMTATFILAENFLRLLSSYTDDYLPGASIRGFRLNCMWGDGNACEYAFIFRV